MNPFERKIATMIGAIFRHWRRRVAQRYAVLAGAVLLGWLLLMVALDNTLMLTSDQLLLGWGGLLAAFCLVGGALAYRLTIARPAADRFATLYERHVPQQHNRLINAVQFVGGRKARSDPFVQAAIMENAAALDMRSAERAVDTRPVRRALLVLGACVLLLLAYALLMPQGAANGLARLFQPLHPPTHLLATEPTVRPGDVELIEGSPLKVEADVARSPRGTLPAQVTLEYRVAALEWTQAAMRPSGDAEFAYDFDAVWHPLEYRVRAGRSVSPTYRVSVQVRPRVAELHVQVTRPAYAGGRTTTLGPNVGDVSALTGSAVEIALTASTALSAGEIELPEGATVPLRLDTDNTRATARFVLRRSGTYAIRLTDTRKLSNVNPPRYTLTAEPDQAPLAIVTRPGRDLVLPADAEVPLRIEAEDDIGLGRIVLETRHGEEPWTARQTFPFDANAGRRQVVETTLALKDFGLQVNDVLLYRVVAYDRCEPAPNVGVGRTWSIAIAEATSDPSLLAAQTRQLLDALQRLLAMQRDNRTALDLDRAVPPIIAQQQQIRDLTLATIDNERKALRPNEQALGELVALADGPLLELTQQLASYDGPYQQRFRLKSPILKLMDDVIARLEALIERVSKLLAQAERAQQALKELPTQEREQALQDIRALLEKLGHFIAEQDQVLADTEELVRKGDNLTHDDLQKIEQLKGTEDTWSQIFSESVRDISKLTEQGFADESIANDYKEMVEQIEEASKNLTPDLIELAVPREQAGRELAESLVQEMEMWLPNSPDYIKWVMEEPLDFPEIPMVDLPDQLWDYIGDLIEEQDELNDEAEDMTSAWADSLAEGAGWEVAGGPISNFSAVGKTGNQLPDNNELSGRAGEGRSGRSQGQLVENVAKGLGGRLTPTRITNDPYEQGVVKELQQMATGGATGGGKARGAGQEGLQGQSPPPDYAGLQPMRDWQQRIRQKAERVAGQLQMVHVNVPSLEESIRLMGQAEQAAAAGRYAEMFKVQQMVLQTLRVTGDVAAREMALRVDRAVQLPADQRRQILDAMSEPVPEEYEPAVRRYFEQLSEAK